MESRIRLFPTYPLALDRGDIAIGGGADGEGELVPPPLSPTLQPSYFSPASLARASADSYPCTSAGSPRPASAFGRRYPYALCWQPPPRQRLRRDTRTLLPASPTPPAPAAKDTHTLLPASPTPPAPSQEDTHTLLPAAPPHPRLRRSSPAPTGGRGPCVAIPGGQPYPALLQDLPMLWTVGISPLGVAARGEGELVPPPLSPTLQPSCFPLIPPQPLAGDPYTSPAVLLIRVLRGLA